MITEDFFVETSFFVEISFFIVSFFGDVKFEETLISSFILDSVLYEDFFSLLSLLDECEDEEEFVRPLREFYELIKNVIHFNVFLSSNIVCLL